MFKRASKIIITESSASPRAHPNVGDVGYINSMYLFFVDKFILLDGFFFSYKPDSEVNRTRRERKRFIIDLGMSTKLKNKLRNYGIKKSFLVNNKYVANLTPVYIMLSEARLIELPNIRSLWFRNTNHKDESTMGSAIKIPYGTIALAPDRRKPIHFGYKNELLCWLSCALQVIDVLTSRVIGPNLGSGKIRPRVKNLTQTLYRCVQRTIGDDARDHLIISRRSRRNLTIENMHDTVTNIQMIYVLANAVLQNCNEHLVAVSEDVNIYIHVKLFATNWSLTGLSRAYSSMARTQEEYGVMMNISRMLVGMFFRCLFTSGNTEAALLQMRKMGALPWTTSKIRKIAPKFDKIKQSSDHSSAALNRIFEEYLSV